jgi:hypothetical protein
MWRFNTAVGDITICGDNTAVGDIDTELFPLTVGHNVNLNKLHAVLIVL